MSPRLAQLDPTKSWMALDAKKNDLLYVFDAYVHKVLEYSWPAGALEGTLTGFSEPDGICVDKSGDVWIPTAP